MPNEENVAESWIGGKPEKNGVYWTMLDGVEAFSRFSNGHWHARFQCIDTAMISYVYLSPHKEPDLIYRQNSFVPYISCSDWVASQINRSH